MREGFVVSEGSHYCMGVNLYLDSDYEYRRGLAHKLLEENVIDFCLANLLPWCTPPKPDKRIVTVDHRPSHLGEYDEVCDINDLPALSRDLMEKMLPYESMAIKIGMRRLDKPTTEYEEEKRKYLQHLRYWNYIFDKYNINLVVTHCVPHSQGGYVKYALARVRGITTLFWFGDGNYPNRMVWGETLESIGESIERKYRDLCQQGVSEFKLADDIAVAYEQAKLPPKESQRKRYDKKVRRRHTQIIEKSYYDQKKDYIRQYCRSFVRSIVKTKSLQLFREKGYWFRLNRRHFNAYRFYIKHNEGSIKYYNKNAQSPDFSDRYILYLPQVFPEACVMPLAGVFAEQYNSIQLLARAAEKNDVLVYVKEHPHSPGRPKDFYDDIKKIKNVKLIKTDVTSYDLMKHSIAVSTQTGTCIWEALAMQKPALVFGRGYLWKGCPGVIEIADENQGAFAISDAMNQRISIEENELRRYLYAFQLESLKEEPPDIAVKHVFDDFYDIPPFDLSDRVELIKRIVLKNRL